MLGFYNYCSLGHLRHENLYCTCGTLNLIKVFQLHLIFLEVKSRTFYFLVKRMKSNSLI